MINSNIKEETEIYNQKSNIKEDTTKTNLKTNSTKKNGIPNNKSIIKNETNTQSVMTKKWNAEYEQKDDAIFDKTIPLKERIKYIKNKEKHISVVNNNLVESLKKESLSEDSNNDYYDTSKFANNKNNYNNNNLENNDIQNSNKSSLKPKIKVRSKIGIFKPKSSQESQETNMSNQSTQSSIPKDEQNKI